MLKLAIFIISIAFLILLFTLVNNSKNIIAKAVFSNIFTTLVATIMIILGTIYNQPGFIDLAIIYTLLGFAVAAILLFFITSARDDDE